MYFLCAYDRTPTKSYIVLKKTRGWVKKISPVLKYSVLAFKVMSTCMGLPVPLPAFIPGLTESEQLNSLVDSLSDMLEREAFMELQKELAECLGELKSGSSDEAVLKKLLCNRANQIDATALRLVRELAHEPENCGWQDEMVAAQRGGEWAWVKKENKASGEADDGTAK